MALMIRFSDWMPGSQDCAVRELQAPGYSVDTLTNARMPQATNGPRNSSTTVMRRMLASIKGVKKFGWRTRSRSTVTWIPGCSRQEACKLLISRGGNSFSWRDLLQGAFAHLTSTNENGLT